MAMQSDRHGFLVGQPIDTSDADDLLRSIKGDTGKLLAAILKSGKDTPRGRAIEPMRRASMPMRDPTTGRFTTNARPEPSRPQSSTGMSRAEKITVANSERTAKASEKVALIQEKERDDQKRRDAANQQARGSDGRFGAGNGKPKKKPKDDSPDGPPDESKPGKGGKDGDGIGSRLNRAADAGLTETEKIDPIVEALKEAKSGAGVAKNVVSPIGRTLLGALKLTSPTAAGDLRREEFKKSVKGGYASAVNAIKSPFRVAAGYARWGKNLVKGAGSMAMRAGGRLAGPVFGAAADAGGGIMSLLSRIALPILATIAAGILGFFTGTKLYSLIEEPWGKVCDWFIALDIKKEIGDAWGKFTATASETWGGVIKSASDIFDRFGQWVSNLPGVQTAKSVVNTVSGAATSVYQGAKDLATKGLGAISAMFESGSKGAGAVSSGTGDAGGASYGTHQLSSNTGTLQRFLGSSGYATQFMGLQPGSDAFNAKWKSLAASDPNFGAAQEQFTKTTHYDPQMAKLQAAGIDLSGKGDAVKQSVYSTAVQFGGQSDLIQKALGGRDPSTMSDAQIVSAIQDYKVANNASLFRSSSPAVQASTAQRALTEKQVLLAQTALPPALSSPGLPAGIAPVSIPRMSEETMPTKLTGSFAEASAPAAPIPMPGQDVPDRTIAHIVTGGIGGSLVRR